MNNEDILNYWKNTFWWLEDLEKPCCFVCGAHHSNSKLEKAHLIPAAFGGEKTLDNLVLLCRRCHEKAPNIAASKDIMIRWIKEEYEKRDWFLNCDKESIEKLTESALTILNKLSNDDIYYAKFIIQDINRFIQDQLKNNTLFLGLKNANENTKVEYLRYLAEMDSSKLKQLFFEFKENQEVTNSKT